MNPRNSTMWLQRCRWQVLAAWLACAMLSGHAATVAAQGLPSVPGLTRLQQPVATAVQSVCITITGPQYNVVPSYTGTTSQRLATTCTRMVSSAFANQGSTPFPTFNLGITNAQIADGVQAIAPVQANAQKSMNTEAAKMNVIGARLLDLRGGARGMILGYNGLNAPATGGAASADDVAGGNWGGFVNVAYGWGNVDETTLQDPYKYGSVNLLAGADYRIGDTGVLGGAISYSDTRSKYDQSLGEVNAKTTSFVGYGTWYRKDWFVDGFASFGSIDYDTRRIVSIPSNSASVPAIVSTATAKPKGDQVSASLTLGKTLNRGGFVVAPSVRLGYIWVKNKAFNEEEFVNGVALAVNERTIHSLQSAVGAKFSTTVNTSGAVLVPYLNLQWLHEFANDSPSIVSKYVADPSNQFFAIPTPDPSSDYGVLAIGASATLPHNFAGFAQLSAALGLKNASNYGVVLGLRKQF